MSEYVCQRPIHPGELIKEEIEYRHLTQSKLAEQMNIPYKTLNDILNGHRSLTTQTTNMF